MAHAQEHMAFRGCRGVSADQTSAIFAQLGGDGDADTQQNITQYFATIPAEDLDVALGVDAACMRDIDDSQAQWQQERGAIEQEVSADNSNPTYKAIVRLSADLYAGRRTSTTRSARGPRSIRRRARCSRSSTTTWYAPNNAILVIAGDVDPQQTLATVTRLYGSIPSHRGSGASARSNLAAGQSRVVHARQRSSVHACRSPRYRAPGSTIPISRRPHSLADVLASQRAHIYGLTVQGKALQTGAQLFSPYPKASLIMVYGALPASADTKAFDDDACRHRRGLREERRSGGAGRCGEARGDRAIRLFAQFDFDLAADVVAGARAEGRQSPDDDVNAIAKVTVDDVNRVAKTYLDPSLAVTVNLVPKPRAKRSHRRASAAASRARRSRRRPSNCRRSRRRSSPNSRSRPRRWRLPTTVAERPAFDRAARKRPATP
jgi:zinc protease